MRGIICYFSTTGNTKLVSEVVASRIENIEFDLYNITKDKEIDFSQYDIVGFASYTDFFAPGKLMASYIQGIDGNSKPAFILTTYGQMSGNTQGIMAKLAKDSGFKIVAGFAFHTPENYPPLIKNGTTNENFPNKEDLNGFNNFIYRINTISKDLKNLETISEIKIKKSNSISIITKLMSLMNMDKMGPKFVHLEKCTSCSLCSKICPYNVITMVDGHPTFSENDCQSCYSCFNHCPSKAIFTKKLDGVGHYAKPHTNLISKIK